jgi:HSP20 family protein
MRSRLKTKSGLPALIPNWFGPDSFTGPKFFDVDPTLFPARLGVTMPSVNIRETSKEYVLEFAAPGLERKDFNIEIENEKLRISVGKEEEKEESNGYTKKEYSFRSFRRTFSLPENTKENEIDAKYESGILKVTLPKQMETQAKPVKKIAVS